MISIYIYIYIYIYKALKEYIDDVLTACINTYENIIHKKSQIIKFLFEQ